MSKRTLYLSVVVAAICVYIYANKLLYITSAATKNDFSFKIPTVPEIQIKLEHTNTIGNAQLWGLSYIPMAGSKKSTNLNRENMIAKEGYVYKKILGIPSLQSIANRKYIWGFFGTVTKDNRTFAIFYNPVLKKNKEKVVAKGDMLDENLKIINVGNDNVTVEYKNKNSKKLFKLQVFNVTLKHNRRIKQ